MTTPAEFREYYSQLRDDDLAYIALSKDLVPEAREAMTVELHKRGLTDLREYKKVLDEAAVAMAPETQLQIQAEMEYRFREWTFVLLVWTLALLLPFISLAALHDPSALKFSALAVLFIAVSCYLGIRARRKGSHKGYVLRLVVPLTLIGFSVLIVLGSFLLKIPSS